MQRKDPKPLGEIISDWLSESPEVDQGLLELKALQYLRTRFYPLRRQIRELAQLQYDLIDEIIIR